MHLPPLITTKTQPLVTGLRPCIVCPIYVVGCAHITEPIATSRGRHTKQGLVRHQEVLPPIADQ